VVFTAVPLDCAVRQLRQRPPVLRPHGPQHQDRPSGRGDQRGPPPSMPGSYRWKSHPNHDDHPAGLGGGSDLTTKPFVDFLPRQVGR
jgi:hypothetical protein